MTPLQDAQRTFARWLGTEYDQDALCAVLATAAVERLDGDPLWLLLVSGSGNAKTETVQSLVSVGAQIVSTISSEGALLSATSKRERTKDATGGLLREIGDRGILVVKDVTSILSMNRDLRGQVLAALREVYDGRWTRNVGTDGGRTLVWEGRLVMIGAVTTAWDSAHSVISSMGDRFVLVRVDSSKGRMTAGRRAIANTGSEVAMRSELAEAVAHVLSAMSHRTTVVTDAQSERLLLAADLVTLARTGVETDYQGNVIDSHMPEAPTRFAKQLTQVVRGAASIGMTAEEGMRLAIRCARDSMPPLRLAIIDDLADHPGSKTADVRKRLDKPRSTVDRQIQALHILGVITVDEESGAQWHYSLSDSIDPTALVIPKSPTMSVPSPSPLEESAPERAHLYLDTDKPGDFAAARRAGVCAAPACSSSLFGVELDAGTCWAHTPHSVQQEQRRRRSA